jgi:hypothetical protein
MREQSRRRSATPRSAVFLFNAVQSAPVGRDLHTQHGRDRLDRSILQVFKVVAQILGNGLIARLIVGTIDVIIFVCRQMSCTIRAMPLSFIAWS